MNATKQTRTVGHKMAVVALALAGTCALAPASADTTLTLSSWAAPTHLLTTEVMAAWGRDVEKASGGRIKARLLPKAVASPAGTFDAVRDGVADVSFVLHGTNPGRFFLTKVVEFPQMGASGELNSGVYHRLYEQHMAAAGEHKGVKVLTMFTHGPGHIFTTNRPVSVPADLSGLKLRVAGGIVAELMQSLGVTAVIRPGNETHELMANGVVDGTLIPYETYSSYKLENLARHVTSVPGGLYTLSFGVIMNEKAYNALPAQDRKVIDSLSGEKYAQRAGKAWDDSDRLGLAAMQKKGVSIRKPDASLIKAIREKSAPIERTWVEEAKKRGVDGALVLTRFREQTRRSIEK